MNEGRTSRPPAGDLHLAVIAPNRFHHLASGMARRSAPCVAGPDAGQLPASSGRILPRPQLIRRIGTRGAVPAVVVPTATVTHRSSSMAKPA
jgi:hypothetical protein